MALQSSVSWFAFLNTALKHLLADGAQISIHKHICLYNRPQGNRYRMDLWPTLLHIRLLFCRGYCIRHWRSFCSKPEVLYTAPGSWWQTASCLAVVHKEEDRIRFVSCHKPTRITVVCNDFSLIQRRLALLQAIPSLASCLIKNCTTSTRFPQARSFLR